MPLRARLDSQILIVDDVRTNVALLEMILRRAGYGNVAGTTDPRETFQLCEELRPDLILLDLTMPFMDGYEVMTRLAAERSDTTYLPILVLTADATPEAKRTALSLGAMDFLTKPFDATEVMLRVGNLLETRGLHIELESRNANLEQQVQERAQPPAPAMTLPRANEIRGDEAPEHLRWLSEYCALLAGSLREDDRRRELISVAGRLHDLARVPA